MTPLEQAIAKAFVSQGNQQDVAKVHALILKTKFILPIKKDSTADNPLALYHFADAKCFVPVFDTQDYFNAWAKEDICQMAQLEISGIELISGLSNEVYLCLNIGSANYKEFAPDELARLKSIIAKLYS